MRLVQGGRVNEATHCRDPIGWDTGQARMLPNSIFIGRDVNAVDLVLGDITVQPLDLRSYSTQSLQRTEGHLPDLHIGQGSGARDLAFDYKLRHSPEFNIKDLRFADPAPSGLE